MNFGRMIVTDEADQLRGAKHGDRGPFEMAGRIICSNVQELAPSMSKGEWFDPSGNLKTSLAHYERYSPPSFNRRGKLPRFENSRNIEANV